jgi:hypothetical protein
MTTYDVVRGRHDVVRRRTTSYVTYDVSRTMTYLYIARTTSHVRYTIRCRMSHVRCRTSCTYDIVRTYDIVGGKNPDVAAVQCVPCGAGQVPGSLTVTYLRRRKRLWCHSSTMCQGVLGIRQPACGGNCSGGCVMYTVLCCVFIGPWHPSRALTAFKVAGKQDPEGFSSPKHQLETSLPVHFNTLSKSLFLAYI